MNPFENLPPQSGEELARQKKVLDYLDKLGIQYDYYRHPPAQSMEDCDAFDLGPVHLGDPLQKPLFVQPAKDGVLSVGCGRG